MIWKVRNKQTNDVLNIGFSEREEANFYIEQMGSAFRSIMEAYPETNNEWERRVLMEGLVFGDLRRIILPKISIDEYVPGDPSTDNIVLAFFIKGVPEAVIPFRDFVMKNAGVIDVAYGDSDTIPNTSIVYVEMSRDKFRFAHLRDLMDQIAMLADLNVEDFSMMFPSSTKKYPYSEETIQTYFNARTRKRNWQAQKDALHKQENDQDEGTPEEQREAMIEHMISMMGTKL